jgi:hypothetical protein
MSGQQLQQAVEGVSTRNSSSISSRRSSVWGNRYYSHHSHKHHHRHKHRDPTQDIPDIINNGTVITPDYTATEFLLKLALVSLALGLIVYIFFPETKGELCVTA